MRILLILFSFSIIKKKKKKQMFFSTHYAGEIMGIRFRNGEPWKKVFGPVLVYLNSLSDNVEPLSLWADAKEQVFSFLFFFFYFSFLRRLEIFKAAIQD